MSESKASGYKFYTAWLTGAGEFLPDTMKVEVSPIPVEMKRRGNVRLNVVEASRVYL